MAQSSDPDAAAVLAGFDHPEAAQDSDAAAVLASFDAPKADANAPQWTRPPESPAEAAIRAAHPELAPNMGQRYTPAQAVQAGASGVDSGAYDLAGLPMDTATNASNLVKATVGYPYSKLTGKPVPSILEADDPVNVVGTSAWLKAQTRKAGGGNLIDLPADSPSDLVALHAAGEIAGPAPVAGAAARAASTVTRFRPVPSEPTAQGIVDAQAANSPQSMGAAPAALPVSTASPELQAAIKQTARQNGGAVNLDALKNHWEADQHGVQLTAGQVTRDPAQFSNEQNSTHPILTNRIKEQNQQMTDALDTIRREAAPGSVQNNPIENGQIAVDSLKAYDEPVQADIRAKYKALTDANGGAVPIDPGQFLGNVDAALKKNYLTNSVPPAAAELLNSVRAGEPLDFEGFEAARSRLAEAQRNGGSEGQAARIIRGELEQIPMSPTAAPLKGLADQARAAAKSRFDALDADPAYQAAVDDVSNGVRRGEPSALADRFLDKYALGTAPKANVDRMVAKLDPEAQQAVTSHTLSTIRNGAITPNGNVSPNGYNSALQKYAPKLDSLVTPDTRESLESLGRVISNAKVPPSGHFVNYSKSGVIMNAAQDVGKDLVKGVVNAKTFGMGVPVFKGISEANFAKKATAPGAGLDYKLKPDRTQ